MRAGLVRTSLAMAIAAALLAGCTADDGQALLATGELVDGRGEPLTDVSVERYDLTFVVAGEQGEVEIDRSFTVASEEGERIVSDAAGTFTLNATQLELSYEWERDEQVCRDVCVSYDTVCQTVSEEYCDVCYEDSCYDDCWDECWDEEYCDEYGDCWVETTCDTTCDTVCETVSYECGCYVESYEDCWEECGATEEECNWVTRTYTSPAPFESVLSTRASIRLQDGRQIIGTPIEAYHRVCTRDEDECNYVEQWVQHDRFVVP